MRIVLVIFSLLAVFMLTISMMVDNLQDRTDNVKTKISTWYVSENNLNLEFDFETDETLFFSKEIHCLLYDRNKKEIQTLVKKIEIELKGSSHTTSIIGKVSGDIRYIDCNFIKD